ncbi:response regulator transcription factor [Oceanispirochaeta crateris]|uniref:response regulator transcription factor n=1 Tax=Oceanispirochaeta crateris TaxID=2518645 RepID=UPI00143E0DB0|nr:response regulator [Oceanispirochaeta crateris]
MLFVDDEPLVRMSFHSLVNWKQEGFMIAGVAVNGEDALKFLYQDGKIDILITDIEMPERDGLSLIKAAHEIYPELHIIVLSAFDNYDYVREAFKLGACDYLLKKDLDAEHLLPLLKKITPQDREGHPLPDQDTLLRTLLYNQKESSKEILIKSSILLHDDILIVCDLALDYQNLETDRISPENLINLTLAVITQIIQGRKHHYSLSLSSKEYVLILSYSNPRNDAYVEMKVNSLLQNISSSIKQYLGMSCFVGVSWKEKWTVEDVPAIYSEAVRLVNQRFFNPGLKIVTPLNCDRHGSGHSSYPVKLEQKVHRLMTILKITDSVRFQQAVDAFLEEFKDSSFSSPMEAIYTALECFRRFLLEGESFAIGRRFQEMTRILNRLQETRSMDELIEVMESELEYLQNERLTSVSDHIKSPVKTAHQYLLDNYQSPDLSLEQAAIKAGVNKTYLSYLFSHELNKKFSDVLTEIRISHACELLKEEPQPIYVISEKTGYRSVEHFSRIFKKITGLSPGRYREKLKIDQ